MSEIDSTPMPRICRQCGQPIMDDYGFCTACGYAYENPKKVSTDSGNVRTDSSTQGPTPDEQARAQQAYLQFAQNMQRQMLENSCSMAVFMLCIWIVMGSLFAVMCFCLPEDLAEQYTGVVGLGRQMFFEGCVLIASVALAVVSMVLCRKRVQWKIATYSCLASAFTALLLLYVGDTTGIYFLLCGLLCTLRIRGIRPLFSS
ncbi:MAG: hypothetical protein MJZ38_05430 [archaeon]|nr:hypothetical protein [archaeon]